MKTYHLTYVTTTNELHTIVCSDEETLNKGFENVRRTVDKYALPVYMLIKDSANRVYYIPPLELYHRFDLGYTDILVFLHECYESRLISLELYNMLNYSGRYKGKLTSVEKDILNNLSVPYWVYDVDEYRIPYYRVEIS